MHVARACTSGEGTSAPPTVIGRQSAPAERGWSATVDATNSAQAALVLPAGVSISSSRPLQWAAPVPEPAGLMLWALGAVPVWLAARRRRALP